ncbi:MAG: aminoacyl-tRNA hydrolase [Gammaproteobacteria bacterium]|nr:aminoacyl-tRNA hydrolase [Gammaproteobacteria bacterium]
MEEGIKLIVGLGNPGPQYENTRHNVGFWLVKSLAEKYHGDFRLESKFRGFVSEIKIADHKCRLLLPETFMNLSGDAVGRVAKFYKIPSSSILVVHDELDFSPGDIRLKKDGGANGHNGVQNIIDQLGTNDFWRIRIGIGKAKSKDGFSDYVLSKPSKSNLGQILDAIDHAVMTIPKLVAGDFASAISEFKGTRS